MNNALPFILPYSDFLNMDISARHISAHRDAHPSVALQICGADQFAHSDKAGACI